MSASKVRIGFIGAGWWATSNHMPVLRNRDDVELAGVCRLGEGELEEVKRRFGFAYATQDYRRLLEECELDGSWWPRRTRSTSSTPGRPSSAGCR